MTFASPMCFSVRYSVMAFLASATLMPSRKPELTITPVAQSVKAASCTLPPLTTSMISQPNFFANSQSRSSWAGTAMIAPVP